MAGTINSGRRFILIGSRIPLHDMTLVTSDSTTTSRTDGHFQSSVKLVSISDSLSMTESHLPRHFSDSQNKLRVSDFGDARGRLKKHSACSHHDFHENLYEGILEIPSHRCVGPPRVRDGYLGMTPSLSQCQGETSRRASDSAVVVHLNSFSEIVTKFTWHQYKLNKNYNKMKFSAAITLASMATASAFVTPVSKTHTSALHMSEEVVEEPAAPILPAMSQSLPFMARPAALDGSLAGDVGFDPLGFAKSTDDLMKYREAEVKHARLAMLAAAGWPISELFDSKIASVFGLTPLVDSADRAPSLLNGGLGKVPAAYWIVCLLGAGAIDLYGITKASKQPGYVPGDLGFDPLGVFPKDKDGQEWFQAAEIKNGRLAMIAITAFAIQEFVSKVGVIDETPLFFKPIGETLHEYANTGYIN